MSPILENPAVQNAVASIIVIGLGEQRIHRCPRYSGPETEAA